MARCGDEIWMACVSVHCHLKVIEESCPDHAGHALHPEDRYLASRSVIKGGGMRMSAVTFLSPIVLVTGCWRCCGMTDQLSGFRTEDQSDDSLLE